MMSADSMHIGGTKEFDWVVTPRVPGRVEVPPLRYPYFDPYARQYEVAESAPVAIFIAAGNLASADTSTASAAPRWTLRPAYRGPLAPPLYRSRTLLLALLLLPLPVIALASTRRPRKRARVVSPAVALRALARTESTVREARTVRRAFLSAAAHRLGAPATVLAEPATHQASRPARGSDARDGGARRALRHRAEFGVVRRRRANWAGDGVQRAYDLYRAIDREARPRRTPRASATVIAVMLALCARRGARAADGAHALFARGFDAYAHAQFVASARDFADLAAHEPRAADAWANLGTAAYSAGDTARAMVGWQRALRLEPLATDVRDRLDLISPMSPSSLGFVPAVPPLPLAALAGGAVARRLALARMAGTQTRSDGPATAARDARRRRLRRPVSRRRRRRPRQTHQRRRSRRGREGRAAARAPRARLRSRRDAAHRAT